MKDYNKHFFYILLEMAIIKADDQPEQLDRSCDEKFYGLEGEEKSPTSLAYRVREDLMKREYHFKGFAGGKANPVFNGTAIRKAKNRYNRSGNHPTIEFEEMYVDALLFYLGKSYEAIMSLEGNYSFQDYIDHTKSKKPPLRDSFKERDMPRKRTTGHRAKSHFDLTRIHFEDQFYLYSYNEINNRIYRAVLDIYQDHGEIKVKLTNYQQGYPYTGILNYDMIANDVVIIILMTNFENKMLQLLVSADLNLSHRAKIYQGQMVRAGKNTKIVITPIFMERILADQELVEPRIWDLDNIDKSLPEYVRLYFTPPQYFITPKLQFMNEQDFLRWQQKEKDSKGAGG